MRKKWVIMILLMGALASCGTPVEKSTDKVLPETASESESETEYLESLGNITYNGAEYSVLASGWMGISALYSEELSGDIVRDSLFNRDIYIEEQYDCDLVYTQMERSEAAAQLRAANLAGDKKYHEYGNSIMGGSMPAIVADNGFQNLHDMKYLSLDQPWWSVMLSSALTLNGKLYYTTGDIVPSSLINAFCMYVNLDLLKDYGFEEAELYETVYNGEWTWDALYAYAGDLSRDLNQDNIMHTKDDFFGFISQDNTITTNSMLIGSGVDLCWVNPDGRLEIDVNNETVLSVVEAIKNVKKKVVYTDQETVQKLVFPEGRALFLNHLVSSSVNYYRDMEIEYSILPMPKYMSEQESYRSLISTWSEVFTAVPVTCPDVDMAGHLMEVKAYMGYRDSRELVYDITLKDKIMRNEDSVRMLDIVFDNLYVDFNVIYNFGGSGDTLNAVILGKKEFASSLQAIEEKINTDMQTVEDVYFAE